jgi:hypothetical protein
MTFAWKIVVSCDILGEENYQGGCFGHAFSKACQYVIANENVYKDLTYILIKITQGNLYKCTYNLAFFFGKGG